MNDKLTVGNILKPQGIRGEMKLKVFCDSAEDILKLKRIFIDGEEYSVLGVRGQGDFAYISLKGIFDRNAAELYRGKDVGALKSDLPELPDGTYYISDLIGCHVFSEAGEEIGVVTGVIPAHTDIYVLDTPSGEVSFAAAEGVIEEVDTENKKITVNKKRYKEVSV